MMCAEATATAGSGLRHRRGCVLSSICTRAIVPPPKKKHKHAPIVIRTMSHHHAPLRGRRASRVPCPPPVCAAADTRRCVLRLPRVDPRTSTDAARMPHKRRCVRVRHPCGAPRAGVEAREGTGEPAKEQARQA